MSEAQFPVHPTDRNLLQTVPWDLVAFYEERAQKNHSQSLETLASRGGLGIVELYYVLNDAAFHRPLVDTARALEYVKLRVELHKVYQLVDHWSGETEAKEQEIADLRRQLGEAQQAREYWHNLHRQIVEKWEATGKERDAANDLLRRAEAVIRRWPGNEMQQAVVHAAITAHLEPERHKIEKA